MKKEGKILLRVSPISSSLKKLNNTTKKFETVKVEAGTNSPRSPNQPRIKQKNHKSSAGPQENNTIQSSANPLTLPIRRRKCLDLEESNSAKQTFISASQSPEQPSHLKTIQIIPTRNYTDSVQTENRMIQTFNQDTRAAQNQEANRYAINDIYLKSSNSIPSLKNHKPGTIKRVQQQSSASNQEQCENNYYKSQNNPLVKSQESGTTNLKAFGKIVKNSNNQVKSKQNNLQVEEEGEVFQEPEIHLSSFEQTSGELQRNHPSEVKQDPPGVQGLHEGIQFLQQNLKQLEKKYKDLTQFQTQQQNGERPQNNFEICQDDSKIVKLKCSNNRPQSKKIKQELLNASAMKKLQSSNSCLKQNCCGQKDNSTMIQDLQKDNELLNEQKQIEINKLQENISQLNIEKNNLTQTINNLQNQIEAQQSNIDSQNIKEKESEQQCVELKQQIIELEQQLIELEKQLNQSEKQLNELKKQLIESENQLNQLKKQLIESDNQFIEQQVQTADVKKQLEIQSTQIERERQEFQTKLAQLQQKHQTAREQIEKKHLKVETELNQTIKKLKSQIISQFQKRIESEKNQSKILESEKNQTIITNDPQTDSTSTSNIAENQLKELQQKNQQLVKQIESLSSDLESLSNKNSSYDLQLQSLQNKIQQDQSNHKKEVSNLQSWIDQLEQQEQERIQTLEQNLNLIQTLKKQLQKKIESNQKNKEIIAQLEQNKADLDQQLKQEKDSFEANIAKLELNRTDLEKQLKLEKDNIKALIVKLELNKADQDKQLKQEKDNFKAQIAKLELNKADQDKQLKQEKDNYKVLIAKLESNQTEQDKLLKQEQDKFKSKIAQLELNQIELEKQLQNEKDNYRALIAKLELNQTDQDKLLQQEQNNFKALIAELQQNKTDLNRQLQQEQDNFEAFRTKKQIEAKETCNQLQDKLFQASQKLEQFHKQQQELKNYVQELRNVQQKNFNQFVDEIQIQITNAFDLKQKQLEQSFSVKQMSNSAQVQTYMNNMKQNFFDQESHIQRLQQENLSTKQALEQQIADLQLKLEFKQLEYESSQASLQSQIEKLLEQQEQINEQLRDQAEELMAKNELIEEANNFIAEFNDEKHELKAKFKLLIGNLQDQDHSVSSYKSTDVVDIDKCFEILEQEIFMRSTQIHQSNQQNQRNTNILQDLVFTQVESQNSHNFEMKKRQDLIQQQQNQIVCLKSTLQQLQKQFEGNWQNLIGQMKLAQEKIQLLESSLFESKEEIKKIQNENLNLQIINQNLENELLEKPLGPDPHNSISLNSNHNESLMVENAQLLQKLQKAEKLLQEARENGSTKQPFLQQSIKMDPQQIESKLDSIRKKLITCIQDVTIEIQQKVQQELVKVKESYFLDKITIHNMANNCIVESWNDQVEIVTQLVIKSELYFIIQMKDSQINILKASSLSNSAQSYLMGFVSEVDGILYIDDETKVLKELVKELAQDLLELRQEYVQYQADLKLEHIENTEIALMDEVEYLTGENKELQLKTKQLCLQNAQLKLQLLQLNTDCGESQILSDRQIEKEHLEEDFISDHDSFRQVIANDMNQNNNNQLEMKLQTAELHIQDLTEKLQNKNGADQQDISCVSETTTLAHIKGTLLQFLKATPLTEKPNEELLKIIYSMLMFTQAEIKELHSQRQSIKGAKSNSAKKGSQSQQIQAQISDSKSQVTEEQSSETTDKRLKRGILGMIKNVVMNTQNNGEKVNKEPVLIAPQPAPIRR